MRSLLLLLGLSAPVALAIPTQQAAPSASVATAAGLQVSADLRDEYLAGFPVLVDVTVTNPGAAALPFPDIAARPWLVRFVLDGPKGKSERHTTPPATDPPRAWSVTPGANRRALLEVPSSAAFPPGDWSLGVRVLDPAGEVALLPRSIRIAPANPVAGTPVHEPAIATNMGAMFPWLHQAATGFDLYLMQFDPKGSTRVQAQYALAHLDKKVEPILARSRPGDALARHVYWLDGPNRLVAARLAVTRFDAAPRGWSLPYPRVELLARGATDANDGLVAPIWVPDPGGAGGEVRAWCISERGQQALRPVGRYKTRPRVVATAVDVSSNLVLAVGHEGGIDLFRVDAAAPAEMPATGVRVWKAEPGWTPAALTFDTLPDSPEQAGGLALLSVLTQAAPDGKVNHRELWSELSGKLRSDGGARPWPFPGEVVDLLPAGSGPFHVLTRDSSGAYWHGARGGAAARAPRAGTLWADTETVHLRSLGGPRVVTDQTLGPRAR